MSLVLTGEMELQAMFAGLKGSQGKGAFRKGCRAASKVVAAEVKRAAPQKSGKMARQTRVRAMKRKRGRVGVMVQVYAADAKGFPYSYAIEKGTKQHMGPRIRRRLTGNVTPRQAQLNAAYAARPWRIQPRHFAENAAKRVGLSAIVAAQSTMRTEIEFQAARLGQPRLGRR